MKHLKLFRTISIIYLCLLCLTGCQKCNGNNFYAYGGDWDAARIPLMKPYEIIILNGQQYGDMNLNSDSETSGIQRVNVVNGIILVYSTNSILYGVDSVKQVWRIVIPAKHIEEGFNNHDEYRDYLGKLGFKYEPRLHDLQSAEDYFNTHDVMDWADYNKVTGYWPWSAKHVGK
jgi:hypothetical protein